MDTSLEITAKGNVPIPTCVRCGDFRLLPKGQAAPPKPRLPYRGMLLENTVICNVDCIGCPRENAANIRAGKLMPVTCMEAFIEFKRPPRETFHEIVPCSSSHMRIRISPDISIGLGVRVKEPGEQMIGVDVELDLKSHATDEMPPYERLLGDAMRGNGELFARQDLVEAQWRIVQPILDNVPPAYAYEPRTWGPAESHQLIGNDGPWVDPVVT